MPNLIGKTLKNRYRIEESLGRGGMADVYKTWDENRSTYLALKLLRDDLSQDLIFMRRFRREARNLAQLQHPNIVRFYGLEEEDLQAFILMDYIEGPTLREEIRRAGSKGLPLERIQAILEDICAALHYAHKKGLVHCDIKSGNVLLDKSGKAYLTDFGISRGMEAATSTMVGIGTPAYMAPELIKGKDPTPQTDIYALGIVLYEMLTGGERPFTGERAEVTGTTAEKVRWEHLKMEPMPVSQFNKKVTAHVEGVINRCLRKYPRGRFSSAIELLEAVTGSEGSIILPEGKAEKQEKNNQELIKEKPEKEVFSNSLSQWEDELKEEKKAPRTFNARGLELALASVLVCLLSLVIVLWGIMNNSKQSYQPTKAVATKSTKATATLEEQDAPVMLPDPTFTADDLPQTALGDDEILIIESTEQPAASSSSVDDFQTNPDFEIPEDEETIGKIENGKLLITTRHYSSDYSSSGYYKFKIWDLEEGKNICNSSEIYGYRNVGAGIFLIDRNKYIITQRNDYYPKEPNTYFTLWDASTCRKMDVVDLQQYVPFPNFSGSTFFLPGVTLEISDGSFHLSN